MDLFTANSTALLETVGLLDVTESRFIWLFLDDK